MRKEAAGSRLRAKAFDIATDYAKGSEPAETVATVVVAECSNEVIAFDRAIREWVEMQADNLNQVRMFRESTVNARRDVEAQLHSQIVAHVLRSRRGDS